MAPNAILELSAPRAAPFPLVLPLPLKCSRCELTRLSSIVHREKERWLPNSPSTPRRSVSSALPPTFPRPPSSRGRGVGPGSAPLAGTRGAAAAALGAFGAAAAPYGARGRSCGERGCPSGEGGRGCVRVRSVSAGPPVSAALRVRSASGVSEAKRSAWRGTKAVE